jgi:hypothetical protein
MAEDTPHTSRLTPNSSAGLQTQGFFKYTDDGADQVINTMIRCLRNTTTRKPPRQDTTKLSLLRVAMRLNGEEDPHHVPSPTSDDPSKFYLTSETFVRTLHEPVAESPGARTRLEMFVNAPIPLYQENTGNQNPWPLTGILFGTNRWLQVVQDMRRMYSDCSQATPGDRKELSHMISTELETGLRNLQMLVSQMTTLWQRTYTITDRAHQNDTNTCEPVNKNTCLVTGQSPNEKRH